MSDGVLADEGSAAVIDAVHNLDAWNKVKINTVLLTDEYEDPDSLKEEKAAFQKIAADTGGHMTIVEPLKTAAPAQVADVPNDDGTVSALDLVDAYRDNELAGDAKYKSKTIQVKGWVKEVRKRYPPSMAKDMDMTEYPCVELQGTLGESSATVDCFFQGDVPTELAQLHVNDRVTIKGTCAGSEGGESIEVDKCALVKP
jgi:hypothetical protein